MLDNLPFNVERIKYVNEIINKNKGPRDPDASIPPRVIILVTAIRIMFLFSKLYTRKYAKAVIAYTLAFPKIPSNLPEITHE